MICMWCGIMTEKQETRRRIGRFMYSKEKGQLVNLSLWFNMSDEYFNGLVTYGEYKRVRKALDACLHSLTMENQKKGGAA